MDNAGGSLPVTSHVGVGILNPQVTWCVVFCSFYFSIAEILVSIQLFEIFLATDFFFPSFLRQCLYIAQAPE
jgi:hypothetical protein